MLTSEIVSQVRRIQLTTGRDVADVLAGAYHSVFKGRGMEFEEVRPYVPGDDVRTIDWNVTARVGAPYVKRYVEERELTVMLLVDVSGSQDFGSGERTKRESAALLSALIAFSAIQNSDKVGLLLFDGTAAAAPSGRGGEPRRGRSAIEYIPPRKGQKHALRVVREVLARGAESGAGAAQTWRNRFALPLVLLKRFLRLRAETAAAPTRGSAIGSALEFCRKVLPRRAVLFLVSDFIDAGYLPVLRSANRRHDVVAARIIDRRERELEPAGLIALEDAESGDVRLLDTRSVRVREALSERASERDQALASSLRSSGIDVVDIDAAASVVEPLLAFFRMRERRQRR
jgi:uncharacterized protein (DUF58 family)